MCTPAKFFRTVDVLVNNTNNYEFALPLDEVLRDACKITAVEAYPLSSLTISPVSGLPVVNNTVFNKSTLTIQTKNDEDAINNIPLFRINPASNNGQPFRIDVGALNPTKCRVRVGSPAGLVLNEVFVIGFWYEKK